MIIVKGCSSFVKHSRYTAKRAHPYIGTGLGYNYTEQHYLTCMLIEVKELFNFTPLDLVAASPQTYDGETQHGCTRFRYIQLEAADGSGASPLLAS